MTVKVTGFDFGQWNESDAITRAQRGDAASFESLYKVHCQHVYHLCLRMLKNVAEAEDLTQQVFLQVFRKIGTFRGDSCFSTWLHRISVNAVLMHLRRKRPAQHLIESLDGDGTRVADQIDLTRTGTSERVRSTSSTSNAPSANCRTVTNDFSFCMTFWDISAEIAALLGCSTGCSKSQLHKAHKSLRRLLGGKQGQAEQESPPPSDCDARATEIGSKSDLAVTYQPSALV